MFAWCGTRIWWTEFAREMKRNLHLLEPRLGSCHGRLRPAHQVPFRVDPEHGTARARVEYGGGSASGIVTGPYLEPLLPVLEPWIKRFYYEG